MHLQGMYCVHAQLNFLATLRVSPRQIIGLDMPSNYKSDFKI